MSSTYTTESMITKLAKKYSNLRFVDSNIKGLYYAVAPDDDRLAVLCGGGVAIFNIKQLRTFVKEATDVWENNIDDSCRRSKAVQQISVR